MVSSLISSAALLFASIVGERRSEAGERLQSQSQNVHYFQPVSILQKISQSSPTQTVQNGSKSVSRANNVSFHPGAGGCQDERLVADKKTSSSSTFQDSISPLNVCLKTGQNQAKVNSAKKNFKITREIRSSDELRNSKNETLMKVEEDLYYSKPLQGYYRTKSGSIKYYL